MYENDLAIFGGPKSRQNPFVIEPYIDNREKELVIKAIENMNFSRYIGSKPDDMEETLMLKSIKAEELKAPWHFLGGPNIRRFSSEFAKYFDVDYAIPVNSATSGISTAIAALGLNSGDEIIIPGLSYTASGTAPVLFNVVPKFVDVDPDTFCIDPKSILKSITKKTKAIMCVHLLGNVCEMEEILKIAKKYNLKIIEDVAQAPGAKYKGEFAGSIGDIGIFSFQQSKNIMTGEGGMIITNNPQYAKKCRLIINHGEVCFDNETPIKDLINMVGCNFRMTELTAALGIAQLEKLERVNIIRNENAYYLVNLLKKFNFLIPPKIDSEVEPIFHILSFKFIEKNIGFSRDVFIAALRAEGIPVGTGYVRAMYENPLFQKNIAYGLDNYPWKLKKGIFSSKQKYRKCINIENLINNEFVWFYQIAHSSTKKDMEDIFQAIEKIYRNKNILLSRYSEILSIGDTSLKQGRI